MKLEPWIIQELERRKNKNLFRELKTSCGLTDFYSNDYLGLAHSGKLFDLINQKVETLNLRKNGATGSRLLSGNSTYTEEVEQRLSSIFRSPASLILNSGYLGNLAVFSAIPQKGDTILLDELAHASIKDGSRLSLAHRFSFRHNDLNDLEAKIKRSSGKIFIGVESIYSMDGDECPLRELTALAKKYEASIILDEAHSTGVKGLHGSGLAISLGLENDIAIRLYTFGKAMGVHGACVAASVNIVQYLINFARPFIYTTALSPHSIAAIDCAFDYLRDNMQLQGELLQNINLFLTHTENDENSRRSHSAIQTIMKPGNENVKQAASFLQEAGFDVRPIVSPTVPVDSERLRICLHTFNTPAEIVKLTNELKKL